MAAQVLGKSVVNAPFDVQLSFCAFYLISLLGEKCFRAIMAKNTLFFSGTVGGLVGG
jgi:hypothetical protein